MTKLSDKRYGPFEITKKVGKSAYKVKLPTRFKRLHPVFNEYLLRPYHPPTFPTQQEQAAASENQDEEASLDEGEYEVQSIEGAKMIEGKLHYLVRWKNFGPEDDLWEPAEGLTGAAAKVRAYYKKEPGAPRPLPELSKKLRLRLIQNYTTVDLPEPSRPW